MLSGASIVTTLEVRAFAMSYYRLLEINKYEAGVVTNDITKFHQNPCSG